METILIVAAHPDDETLGCGIQLSRWAPRLVTIVHVTDGSPKHLPDARNAGFETPAAYGHARRRELYNAIDLVNIRPDQCFNWKFPDQGAHLHMADIAGRLKALLKDLRPSRVYTHPYEGGHPDHDAVAFAVANSGARNIYEFTSYHAGPVGVVTGQFLNGGETETLEPTPDEIARKQKMLECFRTQQQVLSLFPLGPERFRPAPRYDFTQPPHPGPLSYEERGWALTGEQWRAKAAEALHLLASRAAL
jgi:LmbE family N-acetylglucosaminyl deacetylase